MRRCTKVNDIPISLSLFTFSSLKSPTLHHLSLIFFASLKVIGNVDAEDLYTFATLLNRNNSTQVYKVILHRLKY